jgi:hypothetical protein
MPGRVQEIDTNERLLRLTTEAGQEIWCRLKTAETMDPLQVGKTVEIFGWEKWLSRIFEVLLVKQIEAHSRDN